MGAELRLRMSNTNLLALSWLRIRFVRINKVDKKAMIRNRYNQIPHPALNTKRGRDTYN